MTFRSASESSYSLVQQDSLPHEEDSHSDEGIKNTIWAWNDSKLGLISK